MRPAHAARRSSGGDVGKALRRQAVEPHAHGGEVALGERQRIELPRCLFHFLVFEQPAHELGARVFGLGAWRRRRPRQQESRLDLDQHRGHQQVFGGELQLRAPHHLDVTQILARELRHRDVEHVDVLAPDEVEQKIERTLEGLEEHLERFGRDVQVVRQLVERLAVHARERLRLRRRMLEIECRVDASHSAVPLPRAHRASSLRRACAPARNRRRRCCERATDHRGSVARAREWAAARE